MVYRPHDLLRLDARGFRPPASWPHWVRKTLDENPWVVVRRAATKPNFIPVGVRGECRNQRFGDYISNEFVVKRLGPEDLVTRIQANLSANPNSLLKDLADLEHHLRSHSWGPTGSIGYYLATGVESITSASDLDLIIRCQHLMSKTQARLLFNTLRSITSRADVLLEGYGGAITLEEYACSETSIVLRTVGGPLLVESKKLARCFMGMSV
jgi:phosphoribosyl-dephospho-CoA transferase